MSDPLFEARNAPGGIYSICYTQFAGSNDNEPGDHELGNHELGDHEPGDHEPGDHKQEESLSQLDYGKDFINELNVWATNSNNFTTRFLRPDNPDKDLTITLFGEVLGENVGTALGAAGSSTKRDKVRSLYSTVNVFNRQYTM